jgi:hypothetical protein
MTLTNYGNVAAKGPITFVFPKLPMGVTLANATGFTKAGLPFIKIPDLSLPAHTSVRIPIKLRDPFQVPLSTFFIGFRVLII